MVSCYDLLFPDTAKELDQVCIPVGGGPDAFQMFDDRFYFPALPSEGSEKQDAGKHLF